MEENTRRLWTSVGSPFLRLPIPFSLVSASLGFLSPIKYFSRSCLLGLHFLENLASDSWYQQEPQRADPRGQCDGNSDLWGGAENKAQVSISQVAEQQERLNIQPDF